LKNTYNDKLKSVEVLENSEVFRKHPNLIELLKYLIEQEEKGIKLKSVTIAIDLLSDSKSGRSSDKDTVIRTRLFNLRKKMQLFYLTEGKDETQRLSIPKGAYNVKLSKQEVKKSKLQFSKSQWLIAALSFLLLISFITIVALLSTNRGEIQKTTKANVFKDIEDNFFIQSFLNSEQKKINVAVGYRDFYYEYDLRLKRHRFILDSDCSIPSTKFLFENLRSRLADRKVELAGFGHVDPVNVFLGLKLQNTFLQGNIESEYYLANEVPEVEKNYIFIGDLGAGDMEQMLSPFSYHNGKSEISVSLVEDLRIVTIVQGKDTTSYPWDRARYNSYYYIRKSKIEDKHYLFLFSGGIMSRGYMTKHLFTAAVSEELKARFNGKIPDSYEIFIAVNGTNNIGQKHKILYAKELPK